MTGEISPNGLLVKVASTVVSLFYSERASPTRSVIGIFPPS